jgi:hypothetical protein
VRGSALATAIGLTTLLIGANVLLVGCGDSGSESDPSPVRTIAGSGAKATTASAAAPDNAWFNRGDLGNGEQFWSSRSQSEKLHLAAVFQHRLGPGSYGTVNGSRSLPPFDNEQFVRGVNRYYSKDLGTGTIGEAFLAFHGHLVGKIMKREAERSLQVAAKPKVGQ